MHHGKCIMDAVVKELLSERVEVQNCPDCKAHAELKGDHAAESGQAVGKKAAAQGVRRGRKTR
jgi:hypothetical protein